MFSIDIDHFEAFLKQQKKDGKAAAKTAQPPAATTTATAYASATASNGAENGDPDEDLPDVDPSHEQMNLPSNSITLWKILPKLDYASQVRPFSSDWSRFEASVSFISVLQFLSVYNGVKRMDRRRSTYASASTTDGFPISTRYS